MSLLLEALKKAEQAKQGAAGRGADTPSDASSTSDFQHPPEGFGGPSNSDVGIPDRAPITRDHLPDITQPLEILTDDLPSAGALRAEPKGEPKPEASPANPTPEAARPEPRAPAAEPAAPRSRPMPGDPPARRDDRETARRLFEAKTVDYNPRRPFYITMGLLGVAALGMVGYVWWQMQPRTSVLASRPISPAPPANPPIEPVATTPTPPSPPVEPPPPQATPGTGTLVAAVAEPERPAVPPTASPAAAPKPQPVPKPPPVATSRPAAAVPVSSASPPRAASAPPRPSAVATSTPSSTARGPIAITPPSQGAESAIDRAFGAFQSGDFALAQQYYGRVLQRDPLNRDALLGLAAIDVRMQDFPAAEARYIKLLEIDPRDLYAQAGLMSVRGQTDPIQSESRLKTILAAQPDAVYLYYTLGNLYASQRRWPDAQDAYFKAYAADPDNADYAFNLAVSLDHLRQYGPALDHYRKAMTLAGQRTVGFNKARAEARIRELAR